MQSHERMGFIVMDIVFIIVAVIGLVAAIGGIIWNNKMKKERAESGSGYETTTTRRR